MWALSVTFLNCANCVPRHKWQRRSKVQTVQVYGELYGKTRWNFLCSASLHDLMWPSYSGTIDVIN